MSQKKSYLWRPPLCELRSKSQHLSIIFFIPRHKQRNLIKVDNNEGLYGMYYDVNNERLGEAEIVDTNDYYGL